MVKTPQLQVVDEPPAYPPLVAGAEVDSTGNVNAIGRSLRHLEMPGATQRQKLGRRGASASHGSQNPAEILLIR